MKICLVEVLLVYAHKKRYEINVKLSHLSLSQLTRLAGLEILDTMVVIVKMWHVNWFQSKRSQGKESLSPKIARYIKYNKINKNFFLPINTNSVPTLEIVLVYNWYYFFTDKNRQNGSRQKLLALLTKILRKLKSLFLNASTNRHFLEKTVTLSSKIHDTNISFQDTLGFFPTKN